MYMKYCIKAYIWNFKITRGKILCTYFIIYLLQEAAVFVFEKKLLDKYSKRDRELIVEILKKGVSQLTRLRHPKILSVLNPLEESR